MLLKNSLEEAKPYSELKSIKISGTNYKIPVEIKSKRQQNLFLKWLTLNSSTNSYLNIELGIAKEILNTSTFTSKTVKQRNELHKTAESNKIYMQYKY